MGGRNQWREGGVGGGSNVGGMEVSKRGIRVGSFLRGDGSILLFMLYLSIPLNLRFQLA